MTTTQKLFSTTDFSIINGTSLDGYIDAGYDELVAAFGEPNGEGDGYKTDAEWLLVTDQGAPVTVYNYKDGVNYLGAGGTPVTEIRDWHVGSKGAYGTSLVLEALGR